MKQNIISFYTKDKSIEDLLNSFKQNKKYKRFIEVLNLIGDFDNNIEVLGLIEKENIKMLFSDKNFNMYIINLTDNNINHIKKISDNKELIYDLTLAKKFELNEENINFIKTDKVYNTKFGRLITDNKSFYSLFLGNNVGYQVEIEFTDDNTIDLNNLLNIINSFNEIPSFLEFVKIFETLLINNNYNCINLCAYKDLKKIGDFKIENKTKQKIR